MAPWGLTKAQRETDPPPWGLDPRALAPAKIYTDPVHREIHLNWLEQWIVDSPPFQRLRRVRQLGTTQLVYPGATHTRFAHSVGAVGVAQDILDAIFIQREGRHPVDDLFAQWEKDGARGVADGMAKATVQARLGALLHDLGHVPFGHSIEDDREILVSHDQNFERFSGLWTGVREYVEVRVGRDFKDEPEVAKQVLDSLGTLLDEDGDLYAEILPLIVSKGDDVVPIDKRTYPFVSDLVGNTICADLLDYLLRDHLYTGLPAGLGKRFLSGFFVVPKGRGIYQKRLALNIMQDGHERPDVVTELLKALAYRYELSERALTHHAKLAADTMVSQAFEEWGRATWLEEASSAIEEVDNHEDLLDRDDVVSLRKEVAAVLIAGRGRRDGVKVYGEINARTRARLESAFLTHGDDGLLEYMSAMDQTPSPDPRVGASADRLRQRAAKLVRRVLVRDLYKVGARASGRSASPSTLYKAYGPPLKRDALEREVAQFAELPKGELLIWLPDPEMRMKPARVLVDNGSTIKPYVEHAGRGRGQEIYQAHHELWAIWAFVDQGPDAASGRARKVALCFLAAKLDVRWERMEEFSSDPADWVTEQAIKELEPNLDPSEVQEAIKHLPAFAARGADKYGDYRSTVEKGLADLRAKGELQQK